MKGSSLNLTHTYTAPIPSQYYTFAEPQLFLQALPEASTDFEVQMERLRSLNIPTTAQKLNVQLVKQRYTPLDNTPYMYNYYVVFINDVLRQIRLGFTDYIYEEYQIAELLRFHPDLHVENHDEIFYVSLPLKSCKGGGTNA